MARLFLLALFVFSSSALAANPRLFPQPSLLTLLPEAEVKVVEPELPRLIASGATAALFATPIGLLAGAWVGTLSNNLFAALIPALLIAGIVPSFAVVITEWLLAERVGKGRFRLIPTLAVALVAQLGVVAAGILLGVNGTSANGIAVMTLASIVVLPTVTTAMLKVTERPPVVAVPIVTGTF